MPHDTCPPARPRCPPPQPLIPTHEQEQSYGLPKPLLRWHDAEPLLEEDERFGRLGPEDRCVWHPQGPGSTGPYSRPPTMHPVCMRRLGRLRVREATPGSAPPAWLAPSPAPAPCRRERVWRRFVDDELFNRDHPLMRPRTQRKQARDGGDEAGGAPGAPGAAAGQRRARPLTLPTDDGGLDRAYQREYIAVDAKRLRRE